MHMHSQAYDAISSTICQYFTSIVPQVHYILIQHSGQPNDDKDYGRSWEKRMNRYNSTAHNTLEMIDKQNALSE